MVETYTDDIATIWTPLTPDKFGEISYSEGVQVAARFADKTQLITDNTGKELISNTIVYLGEEVDPQSYVEFGEVLSDSNPKIRTKARLVMKIERHKALDTELLYKVFL